MSLADSFILHQLRGWRLLSGAALNGEEWRSILASTKNQLDYDSVSQALTVLFDEQIHHQHRGLPHQGPPGGAHHFNMAEGDEWWDDHTGWWDDPWAAVALPTWEEEWEPPAAEEEDPDDTADAADKDNMAAERSWSQAQKATQQIRKDRGFGAAARPARDVQDASSAGATIWPEIVQIVFLQRARGNIESSTMWRTTTTRTSSCKRARASRRVPAR